LSPTLTIAASISKPAAQPCDAITDPRKSNQEEKGAKIMPLRTVVVIAAGALLLYGLFTVGMPFLLALVCAIFMETPVVALMRWLRMNRLAASTIVSTLFTLVLFGVVYLIGAGVVAQLVAFGNKVPGYLEEFNHYVRQATERTELFYNSLPPEVAEQWQSGLEQGVATLTEWLSGLIKGISGYFLNAAKALPNLFIAFIVFLVALFLISYSLPTIKKQFVNLFDEKSRGKVEEVLDNLRNSVFGFLRAQIMLSVLTYIVSFIGLLILRVEYPMAVSLLIVIVDILPILGVGSVLVPWSIFVLIKGQVGLAIGLFALFIIQTIFRRIVEPKILGDSIGIGALPTLVGLYVGYKLVGVVGLFLGPIVIMIYKEMRKVGLLEFKIKLE